MQLFGHVSIVFFMRYFEWFSVILFSVILYSAILYYGYGYIILYYVILYYGFLLFSVNFSLVLQSASRP